MKGISGIIGGVVVIILLLVTLSLTLAALNYAYGVQQIERKTLMSQLSQPHVTQVSPDSVMTSGRLVASYIIYPDGQVALLNETISGVKTFQSYLDGKPWAVVVFSNGQWANVTNLQIPGNNGYGVSGTGLVPYYPDPIDPRNATQLSQLLHNGLKYNLPIIINNTLMYSYGRILTVPITSDSGWLNFTVTNLGSNQCSFVVLVPNATGNVVAIYVTSYDSHLRYGIYQFDALTYKPFFGDFTNLTYNFSTTTMSLSPITDLRVAIKFSAGQPAQMYIWVYNGSWYRILMPSIKAPVGSVIGYSVPIYYWSYERSCSFWGCTVWPIYKGQSWSTTWNDVTYMWPVNIYSEYVNTSPNQVLVTNWVLGWSVNGYNIYAEPVTPNLGSYILVVPYYQGTAVFNVTYSI